MRRVLDIDSEGRRVEIRFTYNEVVLAAVKSLPERSFDWSTKTWSVPIRHLSYVVESLSEYGFSHTARLERFWEENGGGEAEEEGQGQMRPAVPEGTWTVSGLNQAAQQALRERFQGVMWVVGELQSFDKNRRSRYRHYYFDLVERPGEGAQEVARISAVLFERHRLAVEALVRAHNLDLRDGVSVRLQCRVDLYQRSGRFQLIVEGIDPVFTVGELELNRDRIFKKLKKQGIAEKNQRRPWPLCPLRVGLITSYGSDAYNDFIHQLKESGRAFSVTVHHANVQGVHTESSVLRGLRYFSDRAADFDVVAVVRGGGSRSDLAYFDTEAIGEAICHHPVKVICGVGHQQDMCLLDLISHSTKTPTAAAEELVSRVGRFVDEVEEKYRAIGLSGERQLARSKARLLRDGVRLERLVQRRLSGARREQDQLESDLVQGARGKIQDGRRMDERCRERLVKVGERAVQQKRVELEMARQELSLRRFERELSHSRVELDRRVERLTLGVRRGVRREREQLEVVEGRLELLDPRRVLERGFALLRDEEGVISSADRLRVGQSFDIVLFDGKLRARRIEDSPGAEEHRKKRQGLKETAQEQG